MGVNPKELALFLNNVCAVFAASGDNNVPAGTISAGKRTWSKVFDIRVSAAANADRVRFLDQRATVALSPSVVSGTADVHLKLDRQTLTFAGTVAVGQLINVGGTVYEIVDGTPATGTNIAVDINGDDSATNAQTALLAAYISGGAPVAASVSTTAVQLSALKAFELSADGVNMAITGSVRLRDGVASVDVVTEGVFVATDAIDIDVSAITAPDGRTIPGATATINVV